MTVQINARVPDEVAAGLDRWASTAGVERSMLVRDILDEAVTANTEGRASFERPEPTDLADVRHLIVDVRVMKMELARLLEQNIKRDAALVKSARADTIGVSEARTAIVGQVTAELGKLPGHHVAALTTSTAFIELVAALQRIENNPHFGKLGTVQEAHTIALRALEATVTRLVEQPRTHVSYTVWDRDWSGRKVSAALFGLWSLCVASYFFLAMMLPGPWLAVRSANTLLGGGDQAVCALVNYRMATDNCRTQFEGRAGKVVVRATPGMGTRGR